MRKIIYLVISTLLLSCSSMNVEKQILRDFTDEQNKNGRTIKEIVDKSYPRTKSLDYYIMAYEDRNIRMGDWIRVTPNGYPPYNWPIDITVVKELKSKYKNDITYYWKKKDFYRPKFKIISEYESRTSRNPIFEKYLFSSGLYISKPVVTLDNKYAFIFYSDFSVGTGGTAGRYEAALLENVNGKWKIIATYIDPNVIS